MDPELEELKELLKRNTLLLEDTNRRVHKLQRSNRWGFLFNLLYWLLILGAIGSAYLYITPYVTQVQRLYSQAEQGNAQAQSFFQNVAQTVSKFFPQQQAQTAKTSQ